MVEAIREVVRLLGAKRVVLSGGCFQNARLLVGTLEALEKESVEVFTHSSIPPNDGGISAGQIAIASARILEGEALDMDEALALGSLGPPTEAKKQAS
jgi:hydrogenase maturation protein HypF